MNFHRRIHNTEPSKGPDSTQSVFTPELSARGLSCSDAIRGFYSYRNIQRSYVNFKVLYFFTATQVLFWVGAWEMTEGLFGPLSKETSWFVWAKRMSFTHVIPIIFEHLPNFSIKKCAKTSKNASRSTRLLHFLKKTYRKMWILIIVYIAYCTECSPGFCPWAITVHHLHASIRSHYPSS